MSECPTSQRELSHEGRSRSNFYALDRTNGKFLFAEPDTTISWSKGIGADGKPRLIPGQEPSEQGTRACPGMGGGHNWQATAYSPQTGLYYFSSAEGCQNYYKSDYDFIEGEWYQLSGTENLTREPPKGSLIAMDPGSGRTVWQTANPGSGKIRWQFEMERHPSGGALATAGGLVFTGDIYGNFIALDARSGKVLWRFQTGAQVFAPPVTYTSEGKQYIALGAGEALVVFALP